LPWALNSQPFGLMTGLPSNLGGTGYYNYHSSCASENEYGATIIARNTANATGVATSEIAAIPPNRIDAIRRIPGANSSSNASGASPTIKKQSRGT